MLITQAFRRAAQRHGPRTAVSTPSVRFNWSEVFGRCQALAAGLRALGVHPGDRVAVLSENSAEFLECFFAVPWSGAILVPINTRWSANEVDACLEDCRPRVLIADRSIEKVMPQIAGWMSHLEFALVVTESIDDVPAGTHSYQELLSHAPLKEPATRTETDVAAIFYTGGTTGRAKGAMLTDRNLLSNAIHTLLEFGYYPECTYLHSAPMFHAADSSSVYALMLVGGCNSIVPTFNEEAILDAIERDRANFVLLVPTMLTRLLDHPALTDRNLSSLRAIIYGASPMPEPLLIRAMRAFEGVGFMQGYGMTELSPIATVLEPECHSLESSVRQRLRSAGRPTFGVEVQIADSEGRRLPHGQVGEIRARGPNVMKGYWNNESETDKAIVDGWMCTGDAGYVDEEGFVYVVDRIKDMIISGGENIYSAEVENAIHQHPAVLQCAVIGLPDQRWGETVHAIVVPKSNRSLNENEVIQHCRERIARYKCPKSVEICHELLPLTAAGKVRKELLRQTRRRT